MDDDRQAALDAGLTLGRALGNYEAREALDRLGYHEGIHLIPLNLGGLEKHLPPAAITEAAFELATSAPEHREAIVAAWRSTAEVYADPELLAALTRDLGAEPDPIEIQPTAEQRARWEAAAQAAGQTLEEFLVTALDAAVEDAQYARAMRARKRGRPEG